MMAIRPLINYLKISKNKGSALIVALLIMVLVATVATSMSIEQQTQIQRTRLVLDSDRMYLYTKAVEAWAMVVLGNDLQQNFSNNNTAIDNLPQQFSNLTTQDGFIVSGQLQDLQGRFNLNNLTDSHYEKNFVNLMLVVDPDLDPEEAKKIATATHAFINKPTNDNNSQQTDKNALTILQLKHYYAKQHPPYQASLALMASPSELRLVKGMTANLYVRLEPFITALPKPTPININTASAPVIASFNQNIDLQTAMQIVDSRGDAPFDSMDDFFSNQTIQNANIKKTDVTMNSEYFLVVAKVKNTSEKSLLRAMLYRPLVTKNTSDTSTTNSAQNSEPMVSVLWESRGGI